MKQRFLRPAAALLAVSLLWSAACNPAPRIQPSPQAPAPSARPERTSTPQRSVPVVAATRVIAPSPRPVQPLASPTGVRAAARPTPQLQCGKDWCAYPANFVLQIPIANEDYHSVDPTYRYGSTFGGTLQPHLGVEFQAPAGSQVIAAAAGQVVVAGDDSHTPFAGLGDDYGNLVILKHQFPQIEPPVFTLYGHLASVSVRLGQNVQAGDPVGLEGATGIATGPHLHFEVRVGTENLLNTRNPELWLASAAQPDDIPGGALAGRISDADQNPVISGRITLQYTVEPGDPPLHEIYLETYGNAAIPRDDRWQENYAAGDLAPGWYRITFVGNGKLYERLAPVFPGQVTIVSEIREYP